MLIAEMAEENSEKVIFEQHYLKYYTAKSNKRPYTYTINQLNEISDILQNLFVSFLRLEPIIFRLLWKSRGRNKQKLRRPEENTIYYKRTMLLLLMERRMW